jgi:DNA-binding CsgD family transcriptional regulator
MLVLGRLAMAPPEVEHLVVAGAVLGRCPLALAARLAGIEDPLPTFERAIATGMLTEHSTNRGRLIGFAHPLVQAAVYQGVGPARRAGLHTRAAMLVNDQAARLRHLVAAANAPDARLADELSTLAGQQLTKGDLAAAADTFLLASRVAGTTAEYERHILAATDCMLLAGSVDDAGELAHELAAFSDTARRRYVLGRLALVSGRTAEAERLLRSAWERYDTEEFDLGSQVAGLLANLHLLQNRAAAAAAWARRALTMAPRAAVSSYALDTLLRSLAISGRAGEAQALADALPDPTSASEPAELEGLVGWGHLQAWTDDLLGARATLSATASAYRRRGALPMSLVALGALAETEYRLGAWDDAILHGRSAASAGDDAEQEWLAPYLHAVAVLPLAGRGDWAAADAHVRAAQESAAKAWSESAATYAATAAAHVAAARGDHHGVLRALEPVACLAFHHAVDEPGVLAWRELYVDALVRQGCYEEAEAILGPFEALAAARARRSSLLGAGRARGGLEAARGHLDQAEMAFRGALEHAEQLQMPFGRALLDLAYGRMLRRAGRRMAARTRLDAAQAGFLRLAASPFVELCHRELAACGFSRAERRAVDRLELTPQERAVARLVASGHTNRQAASALVLSEKTVEYHLGKVYAKLGITSRTQLVLRLAQD